MTSRTVLLTGATGFVGKQVLQILSEQGFRARIVVRDKKSVKIESSGSVESVIKTADLFAESDEWWGQVCNGIDTVIHIAWYAEPGKYLLSSKNIDCLSGTLQMAKGVALAKVRRFVGIGTCFEYDLTAGILSIDTPLRPLTPYAGAKASAFMALSQWLPNQNVQFAWCRLFYLYGDGEDFRRFVPYLRTRLSAGKPAELTNGNQIRDFLDVEEAARMIVETALSQNQGAINICSGIPITIRQFAEKIADEYGRRDLLIFGARPENLIDPMCVVGIR
jgi:nucleoside-diphosphate-sugar epimerase